MLKIHDKPFSGQAELQYMTKSHIFFITLILVSLNSTLSLAFSLPKDCPHQLTHRENLQFSQQYQKDVAECWFSFDHMDSFETMKYRSYLISSAGLLFVFNSYGNGPQDKFTGAREYYFFPRETFRGGVKLGADKISVKMNSKLTIEFETKNIYPLNNPNLILKNLTSINPNNAGGLEVLKYNGVFLDTGFTLGRSPSSIKTNKSMFRNQNGQKCLVLNSELFDYKINSAVLPHDTIVKRIVALKCPQFSWVD